MRIGIFGGLEAGENPGGLDVLTKHVADAMPFATMLTPHHPNREGPPTNMIASIIVTDTVTEPAKPQRSTCAHFGSAPRD